MESPAAVSISRLDCVYQLGEVRLRREARNRCNPANSDDRGLGSGPITPADYSGVVVEVFTDLKLAESVSPTKLPILTDIGSAQNRHACPAQTVNAAPSGAGSYPGLRLVQSGPRQGDIASTQ
jgi:hypothetical protein